MDRGVRDRALRSAAMLVGVGRAGLAVPVGYLTLLTGAAWYATVSRRAPRPATTLRRYAILVPAYNEEGVIAETVEALVGLDYPSERVQIRVLADHCNDRTAELARSAGAIVDELDGERRGKGPALAAAIEELVGASPREVDVIVIVDADTVVDPGFLRALDRSFGGGARAVQGQYRVRDPGRSTGAGLRAIALTLRHHVRPLGRTTLGASSGLYGNGMAFTADILQNRAWSNHLTEDIELQMNLLLDGTLVAYAPDGIVEAEMPATLEAAVTQNERWERGRLEMARRYLPRLVRRAATRRGRDRVAALDAVLDHLVPPLSVLVVAVGGVTVAGVAVSAARRDGHVGRALVLPGALAAHVLSGLALGRLPLSAYASLVHAPAMVLWKARLWFRMVVGREDVEWIRTGRAGSSS